MFGNNWTAQYFNNTELSGAPIYTEALPEGINVNWGMGSPNAVVPTDNFSARFTSFQLFEEGAYEFVLSSDAGARLYINDRLIFNAFVKRTLTTDRFRVAIREGIHLLRVEYFASIGQAAVQFMWWKTAADFEEVTNPSGDTNDEDVQIISDGDKPHVFISYSHDDTSEMVQVKSDLELHAISVWTDTWIEPGNEFWQDAVQQAIDAASCVVVLLSPDAKNSIWVKKELLYANTRKVPIIPVLVRGDEGSAIPFGIIGSQYIDLRGDLFGGMKKVRNAVAIHHRKKPEKK